MAVVQQDAVTGTDVARALEELQAFQPRYVSAKSQYDSDNELVRQIRRRLARYRFRLKFRAVGEDYELWPFGVMTVSPFAIGAVCLMLATALGWGTAAITASVIVGALLCVLMVSVWLWVPATAELRLVIPALEHNLAIAEASSKQSTSQYRSAKERFDLLSQRHARLDAAFRERERQEHERLENERREYLRSVEYRRHQILGRNWKAMRSVELEEFLQDVFEALGYSAETTKVTGDQGVDLIVTNGERRIAVQAKGYVNSVSNSAVQQVYAGMRYYCCDDCMVITNSVFTQSARELADSVGCVLIDEVEMHDFVLGHRPF